MSYHDTHCPCGGTKPTETMLCDECNTAFAEETVMKMFRDTENCPVNSRRSAAVTLLSMARGRKRQRVLPLNTNL